MVHTHICAGFMWGLRELVRVACEKLECDIRTVYENIIKVHATDISLLNNTHKNDTFYFHDTP